MAIVLPKFSRHRPSAGRAGEAQPAVNLSLCREDGLYEAGGALTAKWRISRVPLDEVQGIEVSVLWHTEGKGDEDLHVHHFHRVPENQIRRVGLADEQSTHCILPLTPLSYHGKLISLRWCIRLRLFRSGGREIVAEQPFHLVHPGMVASSGPRQTTEMLRRDGATVVGPFRAAFSLAPGGAAKRKRDQATDDSISGPSSAT